MATADNLLDGIEPDHLYTRPALFAATAAVLASGALARPGGECHEALQQLFDQHPGPTVSVPLAVLMRILEPATREVVPEIAAARGSRN